MYTRVYSEPPYRAPIFSSELEGALLELIKDIGQETPMMIAASMTCAHNIARAITREIIASMLVFKIVDINMSLRGEWRAVRSPFPAHHFRSIKRAGSKFLAEPLTRRGAPEVNSSRCCIVEIHECAAEKKINT